MPELPEIEIVKQSLDKNIKFEKIKKVLVRNRSLRFKVPKNFEIVLKNKIINKISRKSKYLILHLDDIYCVIHLGMSGTIHLINKKNFKNIYSISAKKGNGINGLLNYLENYIKNKYKDVFFGDPVLTRTRHRMALKKCLNNLKKITNNKDPELNAEDLRLSLNSLGIIVGKYDIEKLLDIIFKDFCIGK